MRTIFSFIAMMLIVFAVTCGAQTTKNYYIKWNPNAVTDSVLYYEVYLQTQAVNSGWAIVDGAEYSAGLTTYFKANVNIIPGKTTDYSYMVTLPLSGGWAVAGVIANNGIRSVIGASSSKKIDKKPGKPGGVRIEENP